MPKEPRLFDHEAQERKQERLAKRYGPETPLFEDMEEKFHQEPIGSRTMHWYVFTWVPYRGKYRIIGLGPYTDEDEAGRKAEERGIENPVFREYKTRDMNKARKIYYEEISKDDLNVVFERMGHEKTLKRIQEAK